jgi:hypothetical protein
MAKNKTVATAVKVEDFLKQVPDEDKRKDSYELIDIMKGLLKADPKMWGPTIIGFGSYHYKYASGHEGDAPLAGFSPRKDAFSIYLFPVFDKKDELLGKLGKYKIGKGCLYVKKLADIDRKVLKEMIKASISEVRKQFPDKKV